MAKQWFNFQAIGLFDSRKTLAPIRTSGNGRKFLVQGFDARL
jgi:hypothetical protein